jgi:hypothetical protein
MGTLEPIWWDAGRGDDREDPSRVFRSEEADQGDLREVRVSRKVVRKVIRSQATEFQLRARPAAIAAD